MTTKLSMVTNEIPEHVFIILVCGNSMAENGSIYNASVMLDCTFNLCQ